MRAPILHLGDARIGIVRMLPFRIAAFLSPLAIETRQFRARGRLDARRRASRVRNS
jgi:hypothetical protein